MLRPKVESLISEIGVWSFEYIDTTKSMELAGQNLVFTVPTIILYVDGNESQRFSRNVELSDLEYSLNRLKSLSQD